MLEASGLVVELGGRRVLDGVVASVARGEWLALVGPNGAGKTTLLRALLGLAPHSGEVRIGGASLEGLSRREIARRIAYVPQRPVLPASMRVGDFVALGRTPHQSWLGASRPDDAAVVAAVIERLDLGALTRRTLGEVSGGEAQRAVLARALAQEAPVLVLDEPTASLDLGHGQDFLELTDELREERGLCVVSALHDLNLAASYGGAVLLLDAGRVIANGTAREVLTEGRVAAVFGAEVEVTDGPGGLRIAPRRRRKLRGLAVGEG